MSATVTLLVEMAEMVEILHLFVLFFVSFTLLAPGTGYPDAMQKVHLGSEFEEKFRRIQNQGVQNENDQVFINGPILGWN